MKGSVLSVRELARLGLMLAVMEAAKRMLDFLPNVELITLLFIVYTLHIGRRAYILAVAFTLVEMLVWGIHNWVIMYLYMWPLLITIVLLTKKRAGHWSYCVLSALFGLLFGALCSIPYLVVGGPSMAFTWWVAGIPYDIVHCVSNFVLCLLLFRPLMKVLDRADLLFPEPGQ